MTETESLNEGAYEVVRLPLTWGMASILVFVVAYLYGNYSDYSRGWVKIWVETGAILSVGLIFGLIGRRRDKKTFPALVGNLLNGGILFMFLSVGLVFLYVFLRP